MKKLKVLVLCGGPSAEHEVSLVSAKQILANLDPLRYAAKLVFIDRKGRWLDADAKRLCAAVSEKPKSIAVGSRALVPSELLSETNGRPDVAFPILHGTMGEDGTIQGLFELAGIPYVGCGVAGSAIGMDKDISKRLAAAAGVPILPFTCLDHLPRAPADIIATLGLPLFVKPARLGSSVGITKVKGMADLSTAIKQALLYDDKIIVEKGIAAREIECAVLGDPARADPKDSLSLRASVCGEITPNAEFYTYKAKYIDADGARLSIPADLPESTAQRVRELSLRVFRALDGYGMARVDFLFDKETRSLYFNEINTIPGFTPASMYPMLWKSSGIPTPDLLDRLIALAIARRQVRSGLKTAP